MTVACKKIFTFTFYFFSSVLWIIVQFLLLYDISLTVIESWSTLRLMSDFLFELFKRYGRSCQSWNINFCFEQKPPACKSTYLLDRMLWYDRSQCVDKYFHLFIYIDIFGPESEKPWLATCDLQRIRERLAESVTLSFHYTFPGFVRDESSNKINASIIKKFWNSRANRSFAIENSFAFVTGNETHRLMNNNRISHVAKPFPIVYDDTARNLEFYLIVGINLNQPPLSFSLFLPTLRPESEQTGRRRMFLSRWMFSRFDDNRSACSPLPPGAMIMQGEE